MPNKITSSQWVNYNIWLSTHSNKVNNDDGIIKLTYIPTNPVSYNHSQFLWQNGIQYILHIMYSRSLVFDNMQTLRIISVESIHHISIACLYKWWPTTYMASPGHNELNNLLIHCICRHSYSNNYSNLTSISPLIFLSINTLRLRQNGRRFADDTFKRIFLNENVRISIKISLKFVPKGPINNIPALVQIMAWRR